MKPIPRREKPSTATLSRCIRSNRPNDEVQSRGCQGRSLLERIQIPRKDLVDRIRSTTPEASREEGAGRREGEMRISEEEESQDGMEEVVEEVVEEVTVASTSGVNSLPIQSRVVGATRESERGSGFERTTCRGSAKKREADEMLTNPVSNQPNSSDSMRRASPSQTMNISYTVSAPAGFPSTERENLSKGKAVNLDVIYSSLFMLLLLGKIEDALETT
jgi:hypothetical protein